jgi:uncharacterized protein
MSMSLRDQLLKAGLINKKQANEAERQQQRQERHPPRQEQRQPHKHSHQSVSAPAPNAAQSTKVARDQELNRRQREKAEKKARLAQIKQLIEQNRLPVVEDGESYNFIDGTKIRRIAVNAAIRERLGRGEIAIVRHDGRYDLVPAAIATRIRERDEHAFMTSGGGKESSPADTTYQEFPIPDDLMW